MQMNEHYTAFLRAMAAAGIVTADAIPADGLLHRFHVEGDNRGSRNGWAVLHLDGVPAGAFGSWRLGTAGSWCARSRSQMTSAERAAHRNRVELARQQAQAERARVHAAAADRAVQLLNEAQPAEAQHPYLVRKRVPPLDARQCGDRLVLPVRDFSGKLHSLQFIGGDGTKILLKGGRKRGHFIPVAGQSSRASRVLICEGWATGATLAQVEPQALVLAAIDAGNLKPVAVAVRQLWPLAKIIICADADPIGIAKAHAAALAAAAHMAVPPFPKGVVGTDFNDLAAVLAGGAA
jgi:putative DNA primase/helicase